MGVSGSLAPPKLMPGGGLPMKLGVPPSESTKS